MDKMYKYALTYMKDSTSWDTTNTIIVEAESDDDIEENLVDVLVQYGEELADAQAVEDEGLYFIRDAGIVDASVQY